MDASVVEWKRGRCCSDFKGVCVRVSEYRTEDLVVQNSRVYVCECVSMGWRPMLIFMHGCTCVCVGVWDGGLC